MAGTDAAITIAGFLKWNAPAGDVRLTAGGQVTFDGEKYVDHDDIFGAIYSITLPEASFEGQAESGQLILIPNADADRADWWRNGLEDTRIRIYNGEVDGDRHTVTDPELEADMLVEPIARSQNGKENHLILPLVSRAHRLFLVNEGNVCSDRFHQTVWTGERGFANCIDDQQFFAWGVANPNGGRRGYGGSAGGGNGGSGSDATNFQKR